MSILWTIRWLVERIPYNPETKETTGPSVTNVMNNYLCLGTKSIRHYSFLNELRVLNVHFWFLGFADAKVALDFHQLRDAKPALFFDRTIKKIKKKK
jgi:hypothetical protein